MKRLILSLSLASLLIATGCKRSYFDINTNPNSATTGSISANLILPLAMHNTSSRLATAYGWAGNWVGYWSPSGTYAPDVIETTYNITTSFQQGQWSGWYDNLFDYRTAENKANAAGETFYEGIAIIMQTFGWQSLVDLYGNVPYSKAFDLSGNIQPAYDNGQAIYNDLLVRLDKAIGLIKNADVAKNPQLASKDILFGGDKTRWFRLANTLKLKLLIRQSQIPGFNPATEIAKITAEGSGFLVNSANVQPGYLVTPGKLNPFWNSFKADANGIATNEFYRANNFVLNLMKNNSDDRHRFFFEPATNPTNPANPYVGTTYGSPPDVNFNSVRTSNVAGPGLAKSNTQAQWLLTSVESLFLQAEAIQRGWLPGNAKTAYENAVRESFIWLGVPNAATVANNYVNQVDPLSNPNPITNYNSVAAGTTDQKVRFIALQKYIALCGVNNLEGYTEYRRLNVPSNAPISVNPSRIANTIPVRLLYPASEYSLNEVNALAQGTINQFTSFIFWDK